MAGRRAARRILEACRYGEPALTLTVQAKAAAIVNAVAPNLTARLLELADRFLPGPNGEDGQESRPGWQSTSRWAPSVLTRLSDEAAVENNELRRGAAGYGNGGGSLGSVRIMGSMPRDAAHPLVLSKDDTGISSHDSPHSNPGITVLS
jgi:hypothetical protein